MSFVGSIHNRNTYIVAKAVSNITTNNTSAIYMTIPLWDTYAVLKSIRITSTNSYSGLILTVLNDGALHRSVYGTANQYLYEQYTETDTGTSVYTTTFNPNVYIEDKNKVDCLYIRLSVTGGFTNGTIINVTAEGERQQPNLAIDTERTPFKYDPNYRVLTTISGVTTDLTSNSLMNSNAYMLGGTNVSPAYVALKSNTDSLYIGAMQPIKGIFIRVPYLQGQAAGATITLSVWDGSAFVSTSIYDNTSDGQDTAPSTFTYSGVITIPTPAAWVPSHIASDPVTVMANNISSGVAQAIGYVNDPARYWCRIQITNVSNPASVCSIQLLR